MASGVGGQKLTTPTKDEHRAVCRQQYRALAGLLCTPPRLKKNGRGGHPARLLRRVPTSHRGARLETKPTAGASRPPATQQTTRIARARAQSLRPALPVASSRRYSRVLTPQSTLRAHLDEGREGRRRQLGPGRVRQGDAAQPGLGGQPGQDPLVRGRRSAGGVDP